MIKVRGMGTGAELVAFAINLALLVWSIYFIVKIAQHVNAWPF